MGEVKHIVPARGSGHAVAPVRLGMPLASPFSGASADFEDLVVGSDFGVAAEDGVDLTKHLVHLLR